MKRGSQISGAINPAYASGLVAHWCTTPQIAGSRLFVEHVRSLHGTPTNDPTWSARGYRHALTFDGTNDYCAVTTDSAFNIAGAMTCCAWVNLDTVAVGARAIISNTDAAGPTKVQWDFEVNRTAGRIGWAHGDGSYALLASNTTMATGVWYHVAAVRRGSAGDWTVDFYLDGVPDGSPTSTATPGGHSTVNIGRTQANIQFFSGAMDDLRVYNRSLSRAEIAAIAATPNPLAIHRRRHAVKIPAGGGGGAARHDLLLLGVGC